MHISSSSGRHELNYHSTKGEAVGTSSQTAVHAQVFCHCNQKAKGQSAWKVAAGSYENIPSEKSIRSDSRGHKSESTDCGSDLPYCLIKINLVCPMVRMKNGTSKRRLLSVSSFLTIERQRQQGEIQWRFDKRRLAW